MLYISILCLVLLPFCAFFSFKIGRIVGKSEGELGKTEKIVKKPLKPVKLPEESDDMKRKRILMSNISIYDGTAKGQEKIK